MFPPIVPNIVAGHGWLSISDLDLFLVIQHNNCLLDPCHSYWLIKTWYFSTQSVFRKLSWNKTNAAPRLCSLEFRPLTSRSDFNELSTKPTNFPFNFLHQLSLHCQRSHFKVSYQIKAPPFEGLQLLDPKLLPNIRLRPSSCQIVTYKGMKRKTVSQNWSTSIGVGEDGSVWGGQLSLPACYKREDVNLTCVFPHVFSLFYICGGIVCKKKMILLNSWTSFMLTALCSITRTVIYQTQFELASPHR